MNLIINNILSDKRLDALIITNRDNIRYISGYCGDTGVLFLSQDRSVILTDFRYIFQAKKEASDSECIDIGTEGYSETLHRLCGEEIKRIGFEAAHVLCSELTAWKKKITDAEFVDVEDELEELRIIKIPSEIRYIKEAEHIGDLAFKEILEFLKPGVTELEIAARLEFIMKMHGAEGISFSPIVASGIHSSMPHAVPTEKKLESGDFVTMDYGCIYHGYCSDMTRTVVIGKASDKQKQIYNTVLRAQEAVLQQIQPGMTGTQVDAIARNLIDEAGYKGCFGHGLGHGVGLNIHESPRASVKYTKTLAAGMTLTVEPGIYINDFGGVRIEDLGVLTESGYDNFTFSPKELIEL